MVSTAITITFDISVRFYSFRLLARQVLSLRVYAWFPPPYHKCFVLLPPFVQFSGFGKGALVVWRAFTIYTAQLAKRLRAGAHSCHLLPESSYHLPCLPPTTGTRLFDGQPEFLADIVYLVLRHHG
jgi:hypothetical protein